MYSNEEGDCPTNRIMLFDTYNIIQNDYGFALNCGQTFKDVPTYIYTIQETCTVAA